MNPKFCYQSATKFSTVILDRLLRCILLEWACGEGVWLWRISGGTQINCLCIALFAPFGRGNFGKWRGYFQEIVWEMWTKVWTNWVLFSQTQQLQWIATRVHLAFNQVVRVSRLRRPTSICKLLLQWQKVLLNNLLQLCCTCWKGYLNFPGPLSPKVPL